jgi:gliding motility-associated-like protein
MPGAFTPNSDGLNDNIRPIISGRIESFQFVIYNRWGQIVFKSTNASLAWDGRYKGVAQQTGIFIWTCNFKFFGGPANFRRGAITLIR